MSSLRRTLASTPYSTPTGPSSPGAVLNLDLVDSHELAAYLAALPPREAVRSLALAALSAGAVHNDLADTVASPAAWLTNYHRLRAEGRVQPLHWRPPVPPSTASKKKKSEKEKKTQATEQPGSGSFAAAGSAAIPVSAAPAIVPPWASTHALYWSIGSASTAIGM